MNMVSKALSEGNQLSGPPVLVRSAHRRAHSMRWGAAGASRRSTVQRACSVGPAGGGVPSHPAGTAFEGTIVVVELWLGDDAPVPIPRLANAVHSLQRLAPALMLASAWMIASRACSIVGLHGVSFMPDTTSRS